MKSFSNGSQFKLLADGTIRARAGVQSNCAGIAVIHARITLNTTKEILIRVSGREGEHDSGFGFAVPASAIPAVFREAVFEGAKQAFHDSETNFGIVFELLDALVHEIDARESKFKLAGYSAVKGWLELQAQDSVR